MTGFEIRSAGADDIDQIAAIYAHSVTNETASFELEPPDETEMLRRMASIIDDGYPYFVAVEHTGKVVGYAYASAFRPRPAYRTTVEDTVYVADDAKRRGIGKALLLALVNECHRLGFKQMVGGIGGVDNQASILLHEACGFEKAGHFKNVGHKHDQWLDVIFMQRAL